MYNDLSWVISLVYFFNFKSITFCIYKNGWQWHKMLYSMYSDISVKKKQTLFNALRSFIYTVETINPQTCNLQMHVTDITS